MSEIFHVVELSPGSYFQQDSQTPRRPFSVGSPLLATRIESTGSLWKDPVGFFNSAYPEARVVKITANFIISPV